MIKEVTIGHLRLTANNQIPEEWEKEFRTLVLKELSEREDAASSGTRSALISLSEKVQELVTELNKKIKDPEMKSKLEQELAQKVEDLNKAIDLLKTWTREIIAAIAGEI